MRPFQFFFFFLHKKKPPKAYKKRAFPVNFFAFPAPKIALKLIFASKTTENAPFSAENGYFLPLQRPFFGVFLPRAAESLQNRGPDPRCKVEKTRRIRRNFRRSEVIFTVFYSGF
jgi:hypothetical protein